MKPEIHLIHVFIFQKNINIMSMPLIIIVLQWRLYTCIILFESILSHKHFFKYLRLYTCVHKSYYLERNVDFGWFYMTKSSKQTFIWLQKIH